MVKQPSLDQLVWIDPTEAAVVTLLYNSQAWPSNISNQHCPQATI